MVKCGALVMHLLYARALSCPHHTPSPVAAQIVFRRPSGLRPSVCTLGHN